MELQQDTDGSAHHLCSREQTHSKVTNVDESLLTFN